MSERHIKGKKVQISQEQLKIICCSQKQINTHYKQEELLGYPPLPLVYNNR